MTLSTLESPFLAVDFKFRSFESACKEAGLIYGETNTLCDIKEITDIKEQIELLPKRDTR